MNKHIRINSNVLKTITLLLIFAFSIGMANSVEGSDLQQTNDVGINGECTIGVNHASIATHDSPVLWKVGDGPESMMNFMPEDACAAVQYYSIEGGWGIDHNFIGSKMIWEDQGPEMMVGAGLNEAGLGTGFSLVFVGEAHDNQGFEFHVLGHYSELSQIREYVGSPEGQTDHHPSGNFSFIDRFGNAVNFELDPSLQEYREYDAMDDDRIDQGLQGFVVRDNEFHNTYDGTDDTSMIGRDLIGVENTLGMVAAGEFNEQSVVQSDSGEAFRLIRQNDHPWPISNPNSVGAVVIRGAAPGEHPALATMWVLNGNPSFSIAVPTWVAVSDIPDPIGTCMMYNAVTTLFNEYTNNKGRQDLAEWVQEAVLPAEAHLFDMVNNRLLPHWRTLAGPPLVEEMTRVEHQMAWDAYSVVNYLATTGDHNLAPTIDFEVRQRPNLKVDFRSNAADADGSVVSYLWKFGDDTTSTEPSPVHNFPGAGVYLVSVTVTDDDGVTTTAWRYIAIAED